MERMLEHPLDFAQDGIDRAYYEFTEKPLSDSCWSLHTGPDGRVYAAACCEHTGGETVTVTRYNAETDALDYLFHMDEVTGDLRDSGRATQCKIHYSFAPDPATGILYAATHLSGPPKGEKRYNPWASWHDPVRAFRGASLVAFDTAKDKVLWSELMIPKEGCRCLCLEPERQLLYALTYPRDHFVVYDLIDKELRDYGRLGSVNAQCIFTDSQGRAYTFMDTGRLIRFDPDEERLEELPHVFPHEPCQSARHGVVYDAVGDPATGAVYAVPWKARPHLLRYFPDDGENGRLEDLGLLGPPTDPQLPIAVNRNHVGGLVLHGDWVYYVASHWLPEDLPAMQSGGPSRDQCIAMVQRMNTQTGAKEDVCTLSAGVGMHHYISRGALAQTGDLFFAKIMARPAGIYRVRLPEIGAQPQPYIRYWG
jgi:hypothetical protein